MNTKEYLATIQINDIHMSFGGVHALRGISFELRMPQILAIIGPNGAGKTCILNCISGFYRPQKGSIHFAGHEINRLAPYKIASLGISRTFQNIELYTGLTTLDNLMAARHLHMKYGVMAAIRYLGKAQKEECNHRARVEEIIDLLEIQSVRKKIVGTLPYGVRKRVELGRALATEPKLLLLDEPMAGMNVEEKEDMARFILDIHELWSIPIILVEHNMGVVMDIADRVIAIDFGEKIADETPEEIMKNPRVIEAYLGDIPA